MTQRKIRSLTTALLLLASLTLITPVLASEGNFHAVKGAIYINDTPAPPGVAVFLVFPTENFSRTTFPWDLGYNYAINFQGHEGETGLFYVYLGGHFLQPVDNHTVMILQNVIKYHIDLHVTSEVLPNHPPNTPSSPYPANAQTMVFINEFLSWTGGDPDVGDVVTYDVFFGTTNPPPKMVTNHSGTSFDPGLMSVSTKYYWKIVAWDNHGASTAGPIWSFTTVPPGTNNPPNMPANPVPADGATHVSLSTSLSWTGGDPDVGDSVTYDVYFGPTTNPGKVASNQSSTTFSPGSLSYDTLYHWRIVAWDSHGLSRKGPLWGFSTVSSTGGGGGGTENTPPIADLSAGEPYHGIVGEDILFDGSRSHDPDGTIVSWYWTFGDGASSTAQNTTHHAYASAGIFTVKLTVTDNGGAHTTKTTTATITTANLPPTKPVFTGPTSGLINVSYQYTVVSTDPENGSLTYTVDWGDTTSTLTAAIPSGVTATVNHTWTSAGIYHVTVMVKDDQNAANTASLTVLVSVEYVSSIGYLIDQNGDGTYDAFYSNQTKGNTNTQKLVNGSYYIDVDGDGTWDYLYNPLTKQLLLLAEGKTGQENRSLMILGGLLGLIIILFLVILLLTRRKSTTETPPAAQPTEPEPQPVTSTPSKSTSAKKTRKTTNK
jgi:PKD repeat protein